MEVSVQTSPVPPRGWWKGTFPFDTNPAATISSPALRPLRALKWEQNCRTSLSSLQYPWLCIHPLPKRVGSCSSAGRALGLKVENQIFNKEKKSAPELVAEISVSVRLQGLWRCSKCCDARGGSSQHRQDSHFQAWGGRKKNKNKYKFPAVCSCCAWGTPAFQASIRIAPSCLLCCSLKVQHQNATVKQIIMFVNMFHSSRSLNAFLHQGAFSSLFHQLIKWSSTAPAPSNDTRGLVMGLGKTPSLVSWRNVTFKTLLTPLKGWSRNNEINSCTGTRNGQGEARGFQFPGKDYLSSSINGR